MADNNVGADEATGRVIRDTDGPNPSNNMASGSEARAIGDTPNGIDTSIEGVTDNIDETVEQIGETAEDIGRRVDDVSSAQINDVDIDNQVRMADNIVGEGDGDTSFTWNLRGEDVTLYDVRVQEISYVKRSSIELKTLRNEFNTNTRKAFLEDLGRNAEYLRNAGFSETDILKIQNGRVPDGWQVHHILPLDDSGTNSFDNLVLIQNEPYHKVITNYQNSIARQMEIGNVQVVQWPMPNGNIYPAQH